MKTTLRFSGILFGLLVFVFQNVIQAQLPQGFKYQTVVRNNSGLAIANEPIAFRLTILAGNQPGPAFVARLAANHPGFLVAFWMRP